VTATAATTDTSDRRLSSPPGALAAVAAVVYAVTLVLSRAVTPADRAALGPGFGPGWDSGLNGLLLLALALVVLWRVPGQPVGRLMAFFGMFWVLVGLADAYAAWGLQPHLQGTGEARPGAWFAVWFTARLGAFLPVGIPLLLLLYPDGRLLPGRWGTAGRVGLVTMLAWAGASVLLPGGVGGGTPGVDLDRGTLPLPPAVGHVVVTGLAVAALAAALVAVASVAVRHRRARGLARVRVRWLLWAALTDVVLVVLATALAGDRIGDGIFTAVVVLPAAAVTVGLVRPDVVVVDDLLTWTLVNGSSAVVLVLLELGVLSGLDAVVAGPPDLRLVVLVVLGVAAAVWWPLRHLLVGRVRRLVFGTRDDPYDVVAGLASRLEAAGEGPGQLTAVADTVARAFGVGYVRVEVDRPGGERLTATHGNAPAATRALPISFRGTVVGRIVLPRHGVRARLSRRDEALLGDVVRQAALASRSARLAEELQASREHLVLAREEERRRIHRDLHDGLGPALSGVVFRIESGRLLVADDPEAADRALEVARTQVQDVIADVRRLVHDLRPPALDDLGLLGALRQQATALTTPGFAVHLNATDDLGDLPAAVEVAAYRVVGEAVTNAVRHARATRCDVALRTSDGQLHVEVRDDGVGVPETAVAGVGLVSLRERVAELGGGAEVACPPSGGTTVRAWLPLRVPRTAP
jgi:signal transduction histidine kinase